MWPIFRLQAILFVAALVSCSEHGIDTLKKVMLTFRIIKMDDHRTVDYPDPTL